MNGPPEGGVTPIKGDVVMSAKNKALVKRWFKEVWDEGRVETIDELYHPKGLAFGLIDDGIKPVRGPKEFKLFHQTFRAALPNMKVKILNAYSEGDAVIVRCSVTGTHTGDTLGVKATSKKVKFDGVSILHFTEGMIAESWNYYDFMKFYLEIGLLKK